MATRRAAMISYLIAKYVDDLARNEPTNIGVIVYDGYRAIARFDGENEQERIDLRTVRHRITGSHAYRAWVAYWRQALAEPGILDKRLADTPAGDSAVIDHLLALPAQDFYLERGGTILLDADERTVEATLIDLFVRLVRQPDPPSPPTLREKSRDVLSDAGVPLDDEARFKEQFPVRLNVHGASMQAEVSYAVMNGGWHYLQEMPFDPERIRISRKEATHCAFLLEHAGWGPGEAVILYDGADLSGQMYTLLEVLMKVAPTVDVNRPEYAATELRRHLKLG
jgi:hypothetical protein